MTQKFTDDQIIEAAKKQVFEEYENYAYPEIPTDEWGIPEQYDIGCVPWVSLEDITITNVQIHPTAEGVWDVTVTVDLAWSSQDEDEPQPEVGVELFLTMEIDGDELVCSDIET